VGVLDAPTYCALSTRSWADAWASATPPTKRAPARTQWMDDLQYRPEAEEAVRYRQAAYLALLTPEERAAHLAHERSEL